MFHSHAHLPNHSVTQIRVCKVGFRRSQFCSLAKPPLPSYARLRHHYQKRENCEEKHIVRTHESSQSKACRQSVLHPAQRSSQQGWRACACRVTGCLSGLSSIPRIGAASSSRPRHGLPAVYMMSWTTPMDCLLKA